MRVIAHKSHRFMVGDVAHVVHKGEHPQHLDDEAKNSAGFDLCVKSGEISVLEPPAESESEPANEAPRKAKKKTKADKAQTEPPAESESEDEGGDAPEGEKE